MVVVRTEHIIQTKWNDLQLESANIQNEYRTKKKIKKIEKSAIRFICWLFLYLSADSKTI